ncbi:DUF3052 domain-containing protein [Actinomadura rudentiformis]|uniref:DUF3052 domain-containing protein n=1 Tax=Actinomadura rudentiformis TaxID=359158 RepID=A0A6H9YTM8_9ACTN|nr:DUF3052 domain-containing protein [Actinomadura rudentiformis]KAB2345504.1 DUF3052 domain-containing protein [Actinomadura rudentiformis]
MAAQAGYSGTPLPRKLGIRPEHRVLMVGAPDGFELDPLPPGAVLHRRPSGRDPYDVILAFCPDLATLERRYEALRSRLDTAGGLWIAWPKKSSGVATDLSDDVVREYGLATGMVDNKVCAVDQTWSGQRFVTRLADR